MPITRNISSYVDAGSVVLHGKVNNTDEVVYPILVTSDGSLRITSAFEQNTQAMFDYSGGTNVIWDGYAPMGTPTNSSGWLMRHFTYDSNSNILTRQIAYPGVWASHATTTYS